MTQGAVAGRPLLVFALRPVLLAGCNAPLGEVDTCMFLGTGGSLQLPGFGVEMAIKNMEYSALDDSKVFLPAMTPALLLIISPASQNAGTQCFALVFFLS